MWWWNIDYSNEVVPKWTEKDFLVRFGKEEWFCCDNHEMINYTCVECHEGFESVDGSLCKPCKNGSYGRKCGYNCRCLVNHICNNIQGCIQGSQNVSTVPVSQIISTISAISMSVPLWLTTLIYNDSKTEDDGNVHLTIITRSTGSSFEVETSSIASSEKGLPERAIVIYTLITAVLVLFVLLCAACKHRYKMLYDKFKKHQTTNKRRRNIHENPLPEFPVEEMEGLYEVIDESNMIENPSNFRESNTSVTDTNESYCQPDTNGYITPYQPVSENSISITSGGDNSDLSVLSDIADIQRSDKQEGGSSFLNPCQQNVHSAEIHEYLSIYETDDSGSSDSEVQTLECGYLNPYQHVIPYEDSNEYQSIHCCSGESGSLLSETCNKEIGAQMLYPYEDLKLDADAH